MSLAGAVAVVCAVALAPSTLAVNTSLAGKWTGTDGSVFDFVASGTNAFTGQILVDNAGYCLPLNLSVTGSGGQYSGTVAYYNLPCDTTVPGGSEAPIGTGPVTITIAATGTTALYSYGPYGSDTCPTTCGTLSLTRVATTTTPVLGSASFGTPAAKGFGTVKPKTVFLGGDPTGLFSHLSWKNWGKPKATGHGTGFYDPPNKPVAASVKAKVTLVASSLGQCNGTLAYRRLAVSFRYHGRNHAGTSLRICS
jgi:hypothetical protein